MPRLLPDAPQWAPNANPRIRQARRLRATAPRNPYHGAKPAARNLLPGISANSEGPRSVARCHGARAEELLAGRSGHVGRSRRGPPRSHLIRRPLHHRVRSGGIVLRPVTLAAAVFYLCFSSLRAQGPRLIFGANAASFGNARARLPLPMATLPDVRMLLPIAPA